MNTTPQTYAERLALASAGADVLERFITEVGKTLPPPLFYHSGQQHYGFRFGTPNVRHFCFLKGLRVISAYRASIVLAREGYIQEVFVLLRTLTEFSTHIDYVLLAHKKDGILTEEAAAYMQAFFSDFARNDERDYGRIKLRQGAVHKAVAASFDEKLDVDGGATVDPTEKLFSRVYLGLSNYVHGRYPEIMDLYGGDPPRWHASGMSGTPKDAEMIEFLETSLVTASQAFQMMVSVLDLRNLVSADPALSGWYARRE